MQVAIQRGQRAGLALADPLLGVIFRATGQLHRPAIGGHLEFAQKEISLRPLIIRAARAALGQPLIGQRLQPQRGDARGQARKLQLVRVVLARVALHEKRAVVLQFHPAEIRVHALGRERVPLQRLGSAGRKPRGKFLFVDRQLGKLAGNLLFQLLAFPLLRGCGDRQLRLGSVVQERHHLIVGTMRHRIELVRMTLRASEGEAEPCGGGGIYPVDHRVKPKLQRVDAALLVDHRVAMKAGGNALGLRGVGQQVAGDLLDGELIKRQVGIERVDHPIAPRPDGTRAILLVAVGVRVAREVQPRLRPALAIMRTGQ